MDTNTAATPVETASVALPGIGALLKESIALYKTLWKRMWEIAVPLVVLLVAYFISVLLTKVSIAFGFLAILCAIAAVIFYINFLASYTVLLVKPENGGSAKQMRAAGWKYFWPWIWVRILTTLVVLSGMALLAIPGVIVALWPALPLFGIFTGMALLAIPGIVISMRLIFGQFALFSEEKRGLASLGRSWYLMMGNGWKVFLRIFVMAIIFGVAFIVFAIVIGIFGAILGKTVAGLLSILPSAALYLVFPQLFFIYSYQMYKVISVAKAPNEEAEKKYAKRAKILAWCTPIAIIICGILFAGFIGSVISRIPRTPSNPNGVFNASSTEGATTTFLLQQ